MDDLIQKVTDLIRRSQKVIVFTGAGVSTESGIPDFRSPGGVWQKYNPEDFYYQKFISSEESREKYWQMSREFYEPLKNARPNAAHQAVAELEKMGKLDCVITQNIDNLHQRAGSSPAKGHRAPRDRRLRLLPFLPEEIHPGGDPVLASPGSQGSAVRRLRRNSEARYGFLRPVHAGSGDRGGFSSGAEVRSFHRHRIFPGGAAGRLRPPGSQRSRGQAGDHQPGADVP